MTKILLIEDNDDIREDVVEILELSNYKVYEAANGKEGIDLAVKYQPDLILCDIIMPEIDGYSVFEALNSHHITKTIPFIFLTAKAERPDIRKGMDLGADDYLTKPFDGAELLRAIESRLKKKEMYQLFYGRSPEKLNEIISGKDSLGELKNIMLERNSRKYKRNQIIHHEGDRVIGIYFIISGKVKTLKMTKDGREFITGIHQTNDYLDISIIFANDTYTDTAIALEESILSFLPSEQLDRLLYLYPDLGTKFIKLLSNNICEKEERLLKIAYSSVKKRIAESIINLIDQQSADGKTIKISRDNLAALSGTASETVSRSLTDFRNEGLINKIGSTLTVLNYDKLSLLKN